MSLFGSSGIRGKVGERITPELVLSIGAAVGTCNDAVIIAKDTRTSGDMMVGALVAGICSVGSEAHCAGILPTPTLARAAVCFDAGVMVTASHNPAEYNGVKLWNPDGSAFDPEQTMDIENLIMRGSFPLKRYDELGMMHVHHGALEDHREAIAKILQCDCDVVIDCASGPTSLITPGLLSDMGGKVVSLNSQVDGRFPGRMPEPTEENLTDLICMVKAHGGIGLAHDGDGDRAVAVDETGRYLGGDVLLSLFVDHMRPSKVAVPIDASLAIDDMVKEVVRTKVGDVYISDAMKKEGISFGGEPSGTFVFAEQGYCPDGVYAAALLASMASEGRLADRVDELPSYPMVKRKYQYSSAKGAILQRMEDAVSCLECEEIVTLDGFRVGLGDAWFLIRFSGTEPIIRLTAEARDEARLKEVVDSAENLVRRCL